jgi:hypothetical protein
MGKRRGSRRGEKRTDEKRARRFFEGVSVGGQALRNYARVLPTAREWTLCEAKPSTNLDTPTTIRFNVVAGHDQMLRFDEDCFHMKYRVLVDNTVVENNANHYVEDVGAGGGDKRYKKLHVQPHLLDPPVYINPLLNGQTFISMAEVKLKNMAWLAPPFENQGFHYQAMNRIFCNNGIRREKYCESMDWISTTAERKYTQAVAAVAAIAATPETKGQQDVNYKVNTWPVTAIPRIPGIPEKPIWRHPALENAMGPIEYEEKGWDSAKATDVFFGLDGVAPFNIQCNALRILTGQKRQSLFFPPGTEISVTLHKRFPDTSCIERADVTDNGIFGLAVIDKMPKTMSVQIDDASLWYESLSIESSEQLKQLEKSNYRCLVDFPVMRTNALQSGKRTDRQTVSLPRGTKIVFMAFLHENQIVNEARANSYMAARYRFPPGLDKLNISLVGRGGVPIKTGLEELSLAKGRHSASLRKYVSTLTKKGLYSKSFDSYFPPSTGDVIGYDQVLLLDLTMYQFPQDTDLTVNMAYSADSKERWFLRCYPVTQRMISCKDGVWEFSDFIA